MWSPTFPTSLPTPRTVLQPVPMISAERAARKMMAGRVIGFFMAGFRVVRTGFIMAVMSTLCHGVKPYPGRGGRLEIRSRIRGWSV